MKKIVLFFVIGFCFNNAYSQKQVGQFFLDESVYGTIYYDKGAVIKGMLNYNMLTEDMELTENDKRIRINDFDKIEYVGLGLTKFVTISGYYTEMIYDGENIILGKLHSLEVVKELGTKAMSKKKLNSFIEKEGALPEGFRLEKKNSFYVRKVEEANTSMFYLAKSKEEKANTLNFLKLFVKNSKEVNEFIKENKIDFSNEEDVLKLCKFCDNF